MRILQIIDSLPATSGGARFVVNLTKKLNALGINTTLLLIDGKDSHFVREVLNENVEIISLGYNINSRYNLKYVREVSRIMKNYDVIHVHVFPASYIVALASLVIKKGPKIVFTEHSSFNKRSTHFLFKYIEKLMFSNFNHIICLSNQVYTFIKKNLNIEDDRLSIIENAIDIEVIKNSLSYSKKDLGFKEDDILVLMSARLDNPKNHEVLFRAFCYLPNNFKLLVAGDGTLHEKLVELSIQLKLEDRIIFLGSRNDIFSLMKSVDINILCSNYEGLSLAALEAMASGKPFIGSNVEGLDFVINDQRLLFDNSPKDISKIVIDLINDKQWYNEAIIISLKRSKQFDFEKMTKRYIKVYEKILYEN